MDMENRDNAEKRWCNGSKTDIVDLNKPLMDTDSSCVKFLVQNPLEILEVVENVMKHVSRKDLLKCREVCKLWDVAVVRTITRTPKRGFYLAGGSSYIRTKRLKLEESINQDFGARRSIPSIGGKPFLQSQKSIIYNQYKSIITKTQWPQLLLKNVSLSSIVLPYKSISKWFNITEVQILLRNYGTYVKNLEVKDRKDFNTLIRCIGQNGFCPNVQVLKVVACKHDSISLPLSGKIICYTVPKSIGRIGPLKLKKLTIKEDEDCKSNQCEGVSTILDWILKNSAEINSLTIKTKLPSQTINNCLVKLQSMPHITKNLKELKITGNVYENWEGLCKIKFGNLKSVDFNNGYNSTGLRTARVKEMKGLRNFLKMVSESLEFLYMNVHNDIYGDGLDISDLPFMPKLKETSHLTSNYPDNPHHDLILKNCPSLRVLKLQGGKDLRAFLEDYFETKNPKLPSGYVPKLVHKHLETIDTADEKVVVCSPSTIQILNTICPKLRHIDFKLKFPKNSRYWVEGQQILFERIFHALSEMKNLTTLRILFTDLKYNKFFGPADLTQAFLCLKASASLEDITIRGYDDRNPSYTVLINHLLALIGAPKVRLIMLPDFPVTEENKDLRLEAINKFALSNVTLKVGREN